MERESSPIGISVDFLPNRFSLRRLSHFFLSFSFQYYTKLFLLFNPHYGESSDFPTRENQRKLRIWILFRNVLFRCRPLIVRSTHTLHNLSIYHNIPDSTLANLRKTTDETVYTHNLFHFQLSLSYTLYKCTSRAKAKNIFEPTKQGFSTYHPLLVGEAFCYSFCILQPIYRRFCSILQQFNHYILWFAFGTGFASRAD
jgi:hypothetical protein